MKSQKIEQIVQKFDIFLKNPNLLYTREDMFFDFFSEKRLKVIRRTSVSRNVGRISVEGEEIKKFTNSTENFRDGLALKVNMFIFRRNKLKISEIVNHGY